MLKVSISRSVPWGLADPPDRYPWRYPEACCHAHQQQYQGLRRIGAVIVNHGLLPSAAPPGRRGGSRGTVAIEMLFRIGAPVSMKRGCPFWVLLVEFFLGVMKKLGFVPTWD